MHTYISVTTTADDGFCLAFTVLRLKKYYINSKEISSASINLTYYPYLTQVLVTTYSCTSSITEHKANLEQHANTINMPDITCK
jgi:hypothetical protein